MPTPLGIQSAQYTSISTNGTTTLNISQATGATGPGPAPPILYGAQLIALGTAPVLTALDIVVAGTTTSTTTIALQTGTVAGQAFNLGAAGVGIRCKGNLVIVTTGTAAGTWLTLWD